MKKSTPKSDLSKKIKMYSTIATALVATNQSVKAGVVYTDVDPDETIVTGETYLLDLNNDAIPDFSIAVVSGTYYYQGIPGQYLAGAIVPLNNNNQVNFTTVFTYGTSSGAPKGYGPVVHDQGDTINNDMDWKGSSSAFVMGTKVSVFGTPFIEFGDWDGVTDKYAALKLVDGSNTYFGWVRLDMAADYSTITIKDYAYNTTSGNALGAGDTVDLGGSGSSIKVVSKLNNVSAYGFQNKVNINFLNGQLPKGTIEVTNTLGQNVFTSAIIEAHSTITIDEPSGNFYIVSVQTEKGVFTKKVFLQNKI